MSIESKLFKWKDWEHLDTNVIQYQDVVVISEISDGKTTIPADSKFDMVVFVINKSMMHFIKFKDDDPDAILEEFEVSVTLTPVKVLKRKRACECDSAEACECECEEPQKKK